MDADLLVVVFLVTEVVPMWRASAAPVPTVPVAVGAEFQGTVMVVPPSKAPRPHRRSFASPLPDRRTRQSLG